MAKRSQGSRELARIIVTIDSMHDFVEEAPSTERLLALLTEGKDELATELALSFEPLRGLLVPGELEVREGSIRVILHVLGDIAQWTAIAAGVWQMLEYLRDDVAGRVRRFLNRKYNLMVIPVSAVIVPVAALALPAAGASPGNVSPSVLQRYLVLSHALLLLCLIGAAAVLFVRAL